MLRRNPSPVKWTEEDNEVFLRALLDARRRGAQMYNGALEKSERLQMRFKTHLDPRKSMIAHLSELRKKKAELPSTLKNLLAKIDSLKTQPKQKKQNGQSSSVAEEESPPAEAAVLEPLDLEHSDSEPLKLAEFAKLRQMIIDAAEIESAVHRSGVYQRVFDNYPEIQERLRAKKQTKSRIWNIMFESRRRRAHLPEKTQKQLDIIYANMHSKHQIPTRINKDPPSFLVEPTAADDESGQKRLGAQDQLILDRVEAAARIHHYNVYNRALNSNPDLREVVSVYKNPRQHLFDRVHYIQMNYDNYVIETKRQVHRIYHLMHPPGKSRGNSKRSTSSSHKKSETTDDEEEDEEEEEEDEEEDEEEEEWTFEEDLPQELEEYEEYLSPVGSLKSEDWEELDAAFEEAHILGESAAAAAASSSSSSKRTKRDEETWQDYLWFMSTHDEDI
jgi:hypothetical protein